MTKNFSRTQQLLNYNYQVMKFNESQSSQNETKNSDAAMNRALVMDDDEEILFVAEMMLEELGFEVDMASHGAEALDMASAAADQHSSYLFALLDLTVAGGKGGAEIVADLRKTLPNIKVIASSGYADIGTEGFDGCLPKPYQLKDLANLVAQLRG